jgi:AraC-like DNA-binding protein
MDSSMHSLVETHRVGPGSRLWTVRASPADTRRFLAGSPVCPNLALHRIAHVGVADVVAPFRIVRTRQSGTYFLACLGGEGRVLVDGRWRVCRAGLAYLMPSGILTAFHALARPRWQFCWVRYEMVPERRLLVSTSSPVLARFDAGPLRSAILGLHDECRGRAGVVAMHHWVELIDHYVRAFAQPLEMEPRLARLWEKVSEQLAQEWPLQRLAREAGLSSEHLRRLCLQQLGRSPVHQVIHLRMRRAADLLSSSPEKIESIAAAVGYRNPYTFSATFKKWIGWPPSEHRAQQLVGG